MKIPLFSKICVLACVLMASPSFGIGCELAHFFGKLGGSVNVSNGAAYKDQTAGYYTGGNLFARNQIHTSQLATIQLPDYRAGCGGIDMFMGAFSHISSEKLIEALKAIGSNMARPRVGAGQFSREVI